MAQGNFLGGLFTPQIKDLRQREQDEESQAWRVAQSSPSAFANYLSWTGGKALGRGIGEVAGAVAGVDTRDEAQRYQDAVAAVKRDVAAMGFSADDPATLDEFYRRVISTLQRNGLMAEALAVTREYRTAVLEREREERQDREQKRREVQGAAQIELSRERAARIGPRVLQLIKALTSAQEQLAGTPEDSPEYAQVAQRAKLIESAIAKEGVQKGVKVVNRGDVIEIIDTNTGERIREIPVGAKPGGAGPKGKGDGEASPANPDEPSGGNKMTAGEVSKVGSGLGNILKLARLSTEFKPSFSGGAVFKIASALGLEATALNLSRLANANPEAARWWSSYAMLINQIRHELFGATLTQGEEAAFNQVKALIGESPSSLLTTLRTQAIDAVEAADEKVRTFGAAGFNVEGLYPRIKGARAAANAMRTGVSSGQAAPKEPGKPVQLQPNMAAPAPKDAGRPFKPVTDGSAPPAASVRMPAGKTVDFGALK